jgi:hypothetical protein
VSQNGNATFWNLTRVQLHFSRIVEGTSGMELFGLADTQSRPDFVTLRA